MSKKRNLGRLRTSPDALQRVPASRLIILRPPHEDAVGTRTIISRLLRETVPWLFSSRFGVSLPTSLRFGRGVNRKNYRHLRTSLWQLCKVTAREGRAGLLACNGMPKRRGWHFACH